MAIYKTFSGQTYSLGASIGSSDTTILLTSFVEGVSGTPYTMALINSDIVYATIAPGTSSSEFISFTGITQNLDGTATLTGVVRGLAKKYPFTTSATFKLPHSSQTTFIISNPPQLYEKFVSMVNDETVAGIKTFSSFPLTPSSAPTTNYQVSNKKYVDDAVIAGAVKATAATYGITRLSLDPAVAATPIAVGDNDTRVPTAGQAAALPGNNTDVAVGSGNKYVTQTGLQHNAETYAADAGGSDTYAITLSPVPTSYTTGMKLTFKANTENTGGATLNVNSLGAKTIVKGVNTALVTGDIIAGQFCSVIYDGTNFVLLNQTPAISSYVGAVTTTGDLTTDQNIDTTFTCNFTAKNITLYYLIKGVDNTTAKYNEGIATFNGTTLTGAFKFYDNVASANFVATGLSINSGALIAGSPSAANSRAITITIISVTLTQFVVRCGCVGTDTQHANATYYAVATQ